MKNKVAWAAGFFDGEGSIAICRQSKPNDHLYYMRCEVTNTHRASLEIFQQLFGGKVYEKSQRGNRKPSFVWRASGPVAAQMLEDLYPYLVVKKERAELAILFQADRTEVGSGGRHTPEIRKQSVRDHAAMAQLNARGVN